MSINERMIRIQDRIHKRIIRMKWAHSSGPLFATALNGAAIKVGKCFWNHFWPSPLSSDRPKENPINFHRKTVLINNQTSSTNKTGFLMRMEWNFESFALIWKASPSQAAVWNDLKEFVLASASLCQCKACLFDGVYILLVNFDAKLKFKMKREEKRRNAAIRFP